MSRWMRSARLGTGLTATGGTVKRPIVPLSDSNRLCSSRTASGGCEDRRRRGEASWSRRTRVSSESRQSAVCVHGKATVPGLALPNRDRMRDRSQCERSLPHRGRRSSGGWRAGSRGPAALTSMLDASLQLRVCSVE